MKPYAKDDISVKEALLVDGSQMGQRKNEATVPMAQNEVHSLLNID